MTYGHLRADCLYTGISSGLNTWYRVWESLYLFTKELHSQPSETTTATSWQVELREWEVMAVTSLAVVTGADRLCLKVSLTMALEGDSSRESLVQGSALYTKAAR